jgi:hypothetical protein
VTQREREREKGGGTQENAKKWRHKNKAQKNNSLALQQLYKLEESL